MMQQKQYKGRILLSCLLCGALLLSPVRALAAQADTAGEDALLDAKITLYQIGTRRKALEREHAAYRLTPVEYYEQRLALEDEEKAPEAVVEEALQAAGAGTLCAAHRIDWDFLDKKSRRTADRLAAAEALRAGEGLHNVEYYQRRSELDEKADSLRAEKARLLWEHGSEAAYGGQPAERRDVYYRQYQNEEMRRMIERGRQTGALKKNTADTLLAENKTEAAQLHEKLDEVREDEEVLSRRVPVSEEQYGVYFSAKERIREIDEALEKLEERLRDGEMTSLEYQRRTAELQAERQELRDRQTDAAGRWFED